MDRVYRDLGQTQLGPGRSSPSGLSLAAQRFLQPKSRAQLAQDSPVHCSRGMCDLGSKEGAAKVSEVSAETASKALDYRRVSLDCWPTSFIVRRSLKSD